MMRISNIPEYPRTGGPRWIVRLSIAITSVAVLLIALFRGHANLSIFYLQRQDVWLLAMGTLLLLPCLWRLGRADRLPEGSSRLALIVGGAMALAAYAGHYLLLSGYDLSRDEQMASFDTAVFARGELVAPLGPLWRDHADALNTMFMYPTTQSAAWISAYLPLNAAFRALFDLVGDANLTGPAMTLLGALALWGCVRRIWPDSREAPTVAMLLYLGSGQILFNGMTAYAMPAHLALNLCWLWLFLRRQWWADGLALVVGFVAVGLHQPHMHPLFVGPILFLLLLEKSWWRAGAYALGYAAIGAFWLWWPNAMWALSQASAFAQKPEGIDYLTRLLVELSKGDRMAIANMTANLLRFAAWQHLLLIPLLLLGFRVVRRDRLAGALAVSIFLTFAVMAVILPYQGHGFGYRYLHAVLGSCILLAVYGWKSLAAEQAAWRVLLLRTTAAGLAVLLPVQLWMAHGFYAAFAQVSNRIQTSRADYVVVGEDDAPFSADLVINPPYLDRRPIRLLRGAIDPSLAKSLCAGRPVIALTGNATLEPINAYFHTTPLPSVVRLNHGSAAMLAKAGCLVNILR